MQRRLAAIDVGTNSVLLSIVEAGATDLLVLDERCEVTRLGQGLDARGSLDAEACRRTLAVLAAYADLVRQSGATLRAVGTQALREARGAAEFVAAAGRALGAPLEVIDGEREARLTFRAVVESFPDLDGPVAVMDVGGGSTEVIQGEGRQVDRLVSLPVGSVRLAERHLRHDPPLAEEIAAVRAAAGAALATVEPHGTETLVGVAGTVTTLASVALVLPRYLAERVHGSDLTLDEIQRQIALYARLPLAERERIPGMDPRRADVILAGALLVEAAALRLGAGGLRVSDRGVRWGLLHEMRGTA